MSYRNWEPTWRCVTWRLLEPEELVWNKTDVEQLTEETLMLINLGVVVNMDTSADGIPIRNDLGCPGLDEMFLCFS